MAQVIGRVNGLEVIRSGLIVSESGAKTELLPFDDADYSLDLVILIDNSITGVGSWEIDADAKPPRISIKRHWGGGGKTVSLQIPAAQNSEYYFYMNIVCELTGTVENYASTINYSVYRKPK